MASEFDGRFEKKRKSSRKFSISVIKDAINRNKKSSVDKRETVDGKTRRRRGSDDLIRPPESNFCVSPLCINVSGLKTDHSGSPPFSPSILGTKQIFTFDDLFPHIRKSPLKSSLNTCSSADQGIYSDSYDVPHDAKIFQQPFYQPIRVINRPNENQRETNRPNESSASSSHFVHRSPSHFSYRERFLPDFISSPISSSSGPPPPLPPSAVVPSPAGGSFPCGGGDFAGGDFSNADQKHPNEMIEGPSRAGGDRSVPQNIFSRLDSFNDNHLSVHQRELISGFDGDLLLNGAFQDQVDLTFVRKNTGLGRKRCRKRSQIKKQIVNETQNQKSCIPTCLYSSTSEEGSQNLVTVSSDRIWCDVHKKNSPFPLFQTTAVVNSDHQLETSKLSLDSLENSSISVRRTNQVRDSDFGVRDYDTCEDSDASNEEGGLDSSDSSARYGGGLTSNLSLFSSCPTDEEKVIEDFNKYDSDHDNLIDKIKFVKLIGEHCPLSKDLDTYVREFREMVENNKISLDLVLRVWKQIKTKEKDAGDGDLYTRLKEKKRKLLLASNENGRSLTLRSTIESSNWSFLKYNQKQNPTFPAKISSTRDLPSKTIFSEQENGNYKLQLQAAFTSLKGEIVELSTKLESVSRQRDLYEDSLASAQLVEAENERENRSKIDSLSQQYEERLTELHSVIAELTRKIDTRNDHIIIEEDEEDLAEIQKDQRRRIRRNGGEEEEEEEDRKSNSEEYSSRDQNEISECSTSESVESEGMFEESEMSQMTNTKPHTDASTSCEIDDRAVEAGECIADLDVTGCPEKDQSVSNFEEELKLMREEKNCLNQALDVAQQNISSQRSMLLAMSREREVLKNKLKDYQILQPAIQLSSPLISDAITVRGLRGSPLSMALNVPSSDSDSAKRRSPACSPIPQEDHGNPEAEMRVICRLAERVRLKKVESGDQRVTGSDLSSVGLYTTGVAEQLVAGLQEESDAQELFHTLATAGGAFAPHERLKEYELEAERLHSRIDHLRAQNDVLGATLNESKAHCDQLALMTGRAEAQAGALKMGVAVLDQIQEAFEVLSALHESHILLLATTCRVTGIDLEADLNCPKSKDDQQLMLLDELKRAHEQRRTTENVARHLLSRFNKDIVKCFNGNASSGSTNGIDACEGNADEMIPSVNEEEYKVRTCIRRLQDERTRILSCFQMPNDLSPLEEYFPPKYPLTDEEAHKLDLENAVLMQELTAIREDRAELRAQVYLLEREKVGLELRVGTCEAQTAAYSVTIDHLKEELTQTKTTSQESTGDSGVESSSYESESLRRESQLKSRVEDLVVTLEKVMKNSEARHNQSQEFISDLKKANSALLTAVDRLKKKYTLRIKRIEQQASIMVDRHSQQVKILKHRILYLEEQAGKKQMSTSLQPSTTSEASF